jgi:dTDP-4-dehydrorhamnose reductase
MGQRIAEAFSLDAGLLRPIRSDALAWTARRPMDSSLDTSKVLKYRAPLALDVALRLLRERWPRGKA